VARKLSRSGRLLLAALAVVTALATLEMGLRILDPFHTAEAIDREVFARAVLARDEAGTLRLQQGASASLLGEEVEISAQGFRNPIVEIPKPGSTYRVLVLGDSVAFGWGVSEADCFPRVVERTLRAAGWPGDGRTVEVINAGVPGWGAPNELLFLRDEGMALDPDLVLVTLVNNDLTDVLQAIAPSDDPPPLVFPDWARSSYLGRFTEQVTATWAGRAVRSDFFLTLDLAPEPVQRASDALVGAFTAMKALCGDVPFAVIDTVGTAEGWRLEPFSRGAEAAGVTRIEAFLAAEGYRERYSVAVTDDHPNAAGHAEIAKPIVDWIQRLAR
jgi:lysophospholipase L1-like esterase